MSHCEIVLICITIKRYVYICKTLVSGMTGELRLMSGGDSLSEDCHQVTL